jgi:hypothetical protein
MSFDVPARREPSPQQFDVAGMVLQLQRSPGYNRMIAVMEDALAAVRDDYIHTPASEFKRGKVIGLQDAIHFLKTGDIKP